MKATLYLIAITNAILAAASPTGGDAGVASVTPNNPFLADSFEHANVGTEAYCGGFSPPGCSDLCYRLGYRCYQCTSSVCRCTNSGC